MISASPFSSPTTGKPEPSRLAGGWLTHCGLADVVADGLVRHRCLAPTACPPTHRGSGFPRSYPPRTATPGDRRSRPGWISQKFTARRHQLLLGDGDPCLGLCHVCLAVAAHIQLAGLLRSLQKFPAASTDFGVGRGAGVPSDGEIQSEEDVVPLHYIRHGDASTAGGVVWGGSAVGRLLICAGGKKERDTQHARGEETVHRGMVDRRSWTEIVQPGRFRAERAGDCM